MEDQLVGRTKCTVRSFAVGNTVRSNRTLAAFRHQAGLSINRIIILSRWQIKFALRLWRVS